MVKHYLCWMLPQNDLGNFQVQSTTQQWNFEYGFVLCFEKAANIVDYPKRAFWVLRRTKENKLVHLGLNKNKTSLVIIMELSAKQFSKLTLYLECYAGTGSNLFEHFYELLTTYSIGRYNLRHNSFALCQCCQNETAFARLCNER